MDQYEDFFLENEVFLENQLFLDTQEPQPCKFEWPCKCKFEWDPVEMKSICWKCGRAIPRPIYHEEGDFDAWNASRLYGPVERLPRPQCSAKTIRGHQCTYPCKPGKDRCLRHLNYAKKKGVAKKKGIVELTEDSCSDIGFHPREKQKPKQSRKNWDELNIAKNPACHQSTFLNFPGFLAGIVQERQSQLGKTSEPCTKRLGAFLLTLRDDEFQRFQRFGAMNPNASNA